MALKLTNRAVETTQTTGTGTIDLDGAQPGFRTFGADLTSGDTTPYVIVDDPNAPTAYEYGIGTWTAGSPNTLARTDIQGSSNSGNAISLQSGQTYVVTGSPIANVLLLTDAVADQSEHNAPSGVEKLARLDRLAASAGFPFANMPTVGADEIVKKGSNANGVFTQFADGTLICAHELTFTFSASPAETVTWTYPVAFTSAAYVVGKASSSTRYFVSSNSRGTTSSIAVVLRQHNDDNATGDFKAVVLAFGSWK